MPVRIAMLVNGVGQDHDVEPRTLLVQYLREACGLTGTKVGCDTSSCGACTVLARRRVDEVVHDVRRPGRRRRRSRRSRAWPPTASCTRSSRRSTRTTALQCGFCTAGHGDGRGVVPRGEPEPDRAAGAARPRGQPLPLHRLPQHREGGARRRRQPDGDDTGEPGHDRGDRVPAAAPGGRPDPDRFGPLRRRPRRSPARCTSRLVRSPFAHARIRSIDTAAADGVSRRRRGVHRRRPRRPTSRHRFPARGR